MAREVKQMPQAADAEPKPSQSRAGILALGLLLLGTPAFADDLTQGATYHADAARSGNFVAAGLTWASAATMHRDTSFGGAFAGIAKDQPLYWRAPGATHGIVVLGTDQDVIQAFDSVTGAPVWSAKLGTPFTQSVPHCGTPRSVGVLGTPVIDPSAGILYALDSAKDSSGADQYAIWAISLTNGAAQPGWPLILAPAIAKLGLTFTPVIQDQHTSLALVGGRIYAGFAANHGDCGNYHGWIVGIDPATAAVTGAWESRATRAGVWSEGGVVTDGTDLFFTTGNGTEPKAWLDGDAVFRLPTTLAHVTSTKDYFVAPNFEALDKADLDLGGTSPLPVDVPLAGGGAAQWLVQIGKDGTVYVLDRANLGGIGGSLLQQSVVQLPEITAPAVFPVSGGLIMAFNGVGTNCPAPVSSPLLIALSLRAQPGPSLRTQWCAELKISGNPSGSAVPIVTTTDGTTDPIVWITAPAGDERLHGFRGDTGAVLFNGGGKGDGMAGLQRHSSILVAEGRLFIAGAGQLYAFDYTPGL